MGFIYVITNKVNNKQYVGQTRQSISKRFAEHIYASKQSTPPQTISKAIKKYSPKNFIVEQLEECDNELLDEKEIYWIKQLDTYNCGYNETRGGQYNFAIGIPIVLVDVITLQVQKRYDSMSDGIRDFGSHIIECCNHKKKHLKNGIIAYTEKEYNNFTKEQLKLDIDSRINVICQLNYYGELLKQWISTRDIARYYNCNWGQISACCLGLSKSAYGYVWCYRKDLDKHLNKIHSYNHSKPIIQFTKDKQQIKIWLSAAEIEKELQIPNGQLSRCCQKNAKRKFDTDKLATCHQYIWTYAPSQILYCK